MKSLAAAFSTILLSSCASAGVETPWHPTQTGCANQSIGDTLLWWRNAPLSSASYRLAVDPDTGQGPTVLVVIDSGKLINLGNPDDSPVFIGAVGDSSKTCAVRTPITQCQAAISVYEAIRSESIPLGFDTDDPIEIRISHAPAYYLEFSDGQGNHNQWRFYGNDHPLQEVIESSIGALESCWLPAWDAYHAR